MIAALKAVADPGNAIPRRRGHGSERQGGFQVPRCLPAILRDSNTVGLYFRDGFAGQLGPNIFLRRTTLAGWPGQRVQ